MGVVVAVNDEQSEANFLAYYSVKMSRIVKKISMCKKVSFIYFTIYFWTLQISNNLEKKSDERFLKEHLERESISRHKRFFLHLKCFSAQLFCCKEENCQSKVWKFLNSISCCIWMNHFQISKVVTILDATKKSEIECLHENLKNLSHLVAVGTYGGDCLLLHFGIDFPNVTDLELRKPPFSSNLCSEFSIRLITCYRSKAMNKFVCLSINELYYKIWKIK